MAPSNLSHTHAPIVIVNFLWSIYKSFDFKEPIYSWYQIKRKDSNIIETLCRQGYPDQNPLMGFNWSYFLFFLPVWIKILVAKRQLTVQIFRPRFLPYIEKIFKLWCFNWRKNVKKDCGNWTTKIGLWELWCFKKNVCPGSCFQC